MLPVLLCTMAVSYTHLNANGVYGQSAGNDKITSTNTVTGGGTYNITVFDQGE